VLRRYSRGCDETVAANFEVAALSVLLYFTLLFLQQNKFKNK